jgi:hypothetical protein
MADDQRTIKIVLETKQAEKNTDKLGDSIKKAKGEAQGFSGVMTKQGGGISTLIERYAKFLGPLAAVTAAWKLGKAAIQSNLELTLALDRTMAGFSAVLSQVTADLGNWIEMMTEGGSEHSYFSELIQQTSTHLINMARDLGFTGEAIFEYTKHLLAAETAGRELVDIQFKMKEAMLINKIEISEARQELEKLRLASRDEQKTEGERFEAQKLAIEQVKVLRKEREDELAIRQLEIDAMNKAKAGTVDLYQVRLKQHELDKDRVETETSLIMLENTLTERLNTLQRAYTTFLNTQSKVVEEEERWEESVFDSNLIIQQRNEAVVTMNEITAAATEKVKQHTEATEENAEAQDEYNVSFQTSVNILTRMVNLFKNFNFSSLMSLIFSGFGIASRFVDPTGFTGKVGKVLGGVFFGKQGGIVQGPSHEQGGVRFNIGGVVNELEGGEGVINKQSMGIPWVKSLASQLNQIGGGVRFAQGGIATGPTALEAQTARLETLLKQRQIVAITEDIQTGLNTVQVQSDISSI